MEDDMTNDRANNKLKVTPKYFYDVCYRNKRFELRKDDRDYKVGDVIIETWERVKRL